MAQCPGKDMRNLTVSYHPCPNCHQPVEMFSDEARVRCQNCGTKVYKEQAPNCLQWCSAARECFGPKLYDQLMDRISGKEKPEPS